MSYGLDDTSTPSVAAMRSANPPISFVCRYVGYYSGYNLNDIATQQGKCLTPGEAKTLSQGGIALVSNYEWYNTRAINDGLGHGWTSQQAFDAGIWDAQTAQKIHVACGGPADRPIYFSVDFNTGVTSLIIDYFKGIASVIGLARTGAYGGYACIKGLLDAGAITWAWQTYAWSGGQWDERAHIRQYQNGVTFGGRSVDYDESMQADFGQWVTQGGYMIPAGWKDDGTTLTAPNGVPVIQGFREWVLSHPWDSGNWPLAPSAGRNPLEDSNSSLGGGTFQIFRWSMLEWTTDRGVFVSWIGQELIKARQEIDALKSAPPTPAPVDTSLVESDINAIADGLAPLIARALTDLKKL